MRLARALSPHVVQHGGRAYRVRPPCVGEALVLLATQPGADDADPARFDAALAAWLPLSLYSALRASPALSLHLVRRVLQADVPARLGAAGLDAGGGALSWEAAVADYALAYAVRPADVLAEPWPLFLALAAELAAATARAQLRQVDLVVLPHAGSHAAEIMGRLRRAAGLGHGAPRTVSRMLVDHAYREEQLAALSHAFGAA